MICIDGRKMKNKEYVFVDFFDTLMFRSVHSCQMIRQWDNILAQKLCIQVGVLTRYRKKVISEMHRDECAINYRTLCDGIWDKIKNGSSELVSERIGIKKDSFYSLSLEIETYLEFGVQYINIEMYRFLEKMKRRGKKLILVTDFYLPSESYHVFGKKCGSDGLLDRIFCSSDIGLTKAGKGLLYSYILKELGIHASQVIMIGDSLRSDKLNAQKYGITAYRYFPLRHKVRTNLSRIMKIDGSYACYRNIIKIAKSDQMFGEYVLPLIYFTKHLYVELYQDGQSTANFLSRGGYYLKRLFDVYQKLCIPESKKIHSRYVLNSRKVNIRATEDPDAKRSLLGYLKGFTDGDRFVFIDEGWYGHGQLVYTRELGLKTKGYYLGLMDNFSVKDCKRKGILF